MNQPLNQHAYQPYPPPQDPKPLAVAVGVAALLGALTAVQSWVNSYDLLVSDTGRRSTDSRDWRVVGALVDIPLSSVQIILLAWGVWALYQHRIGARVLIIAGCVIACLSACSDRLFNWMYYSPTISKPVLEAVLEAGFACVYPAITVLLVTRPLLRRWFVPAGMPSQLAPHHVSPQQRDPLAGAVFSGLAAVAGIGWAALQLLDGLDEPAPGHGINLMQNILRAAQIVLLSGGVLGLWRRHRIGRVLILAALPLALIHALVYTIGKWDTWRIYQSIPKSLYDFAFEVAFLAGPAAVAGALMLAPWSRVWFKPKSVPSSVKPHLAR
ncbi:hypothetical protein HLB23_04120 [Nocardia uniformis]|uniref:Uncharacterized protein n=1 Tax=Nocardia uniformis TaxID=53432 RepID=A0A849BY81_9NOCA|nr:hypothetical protein [Nocardia uniformis]NNH69065.1 hypothetical protein [Nocardia uniformis]